MADAPDSKSGRGNPVGVQVPPPAPNPSDFTRSRIHLCSGSHPDGALHNKNIASIRGSQVEFSLQSKKQDPHYSPNTVTTDPALSGINVGAPGGQHCNCDGTQFDVFIRHAISL
jgi:hypothetical protein